MKTNPIQTSDTSSYERNPGRGSIEAQIGLLLVLGLIAGLILMEVAGSLKPFTQRLELQASFETIKDLKSGDPVKMAGMTIGRVASMTLDEGKVRVVMSLDTKHQKAIKTDSLASIEFEGLMGQHYLSLSFGKQGLPVEPGTMLESLEQPDLNQLMKRLDGVAEGVRNMTASFSGDSLNAILGPLGDLINHNKDKVSNLLTHLESVSQKLAQGEGTLGRILTDATLYETALAAIQKLDAAGSEIQLTAEEARSVMSLINTGQGSLGKLATDPALHDEAKLAMTQLREILEKLNQGKGSLGMIINDPSLVQQATTTLQKVNKATESLEDQGPMSVLGMAVGNLF